MSSAMLIDIVSAESQLYSGPATMVIAASTVGELGIVPRHAPLLAILPAGPLRVQIDDAEQVFYLSGGILEVQQQYRPDPVTVVTVLADVALRALDIDESRAQAAKQEAEKLLAENQSAKLEYAEAAAELARAVAQLRTLQALRKQVKA